MAKKAGFPQQFYVGGRDISGDVGSIGSRSSPRPVLDVTGINQSGYHRVLGLGDAQLDFNSWFNDATGQEHLAFKGLPTADILVLWALGGAAADVAALIVGKQINYDPTRGQDGSLAIAIQVLANAIALEWGDLLTAGKVTHASATSSASVDNAALSSNGAAAMMQMVSLATGTCTVTIEDSADNAVWATIITFAAVAAAAAPTAERLTVASTVRRYLRVTTTGVFTTAVIIVAVRRGTAQDVVAY